MFQEFSEFKDIKLINSLKRLPTITTNLKKWCIVYSIDKLFLPETVNEADKSKCDIHVLVFEITIQ